MATGTISSVGIGTSGLDVSSIISKLVDLEKAPLTDLQTKAATITTKITAYGQIQSLASTLSDAALNLSLSTTWKAVNATSSNTSAVQVTTSGTSIPALNSFSVQVSQLAKAQSTATASLPATESVGAGQLQIQLGSWNSTHDTFTAGSLAAASITVDPTDTIANVASKINAAGAGVTATVLTDSNGQRLMVRSNATGETSGFRIQAVEGGDPSLDVDDTGLSRLAFDPAAGAFGMASSANSVATQYGQNATATINNIAVTSTSNTFSDTIPGLKLTVSQVTTSAADVSVAADTESMTKSIQTFVDAYNALNTFISQNTAYDSSSKQGGLLQGDSAANGVQNLLRTLIGSTTSGGAFTRISDIGVSIQQDGSLAVDSAKLSNAMGDMTSLSNLFSTTANDASANGFGVKLKALMTGMLNTDGTITNREASLQTEKQKNTDDQNAVNDHVSQVQDRLQKTYTALDTQMASLSALNAYITQQVAQWNKSTG